MEQVTIHTGDSELDGANGIQSIPYTINTYCHSPVSGPTVDWETIYKLDDAARDVQHSIYMAVVAGNDCTIELDGTNAPIARHDRIAQEVILGIRTDLGDIYNARVSTASLSGSVHVLKAEAIQTQTLLAAM